MAGAVFAYEVVITMRFTVEIEREENGRWLAEIPELSGRRVKIFKLAFSQRITSCPGVPVCCLS
jgi:hypothetical protein